MKINRRYLVFYNYQITNSDPEYKTMEMISDGYYHPPIFEDENSLNIIEAYIKDTQADQYNGIDQEYDYFRITGITILPIHESLNQ